MPHKWEQIGEMHTFSNGETLTYYRCPICNRHKKEGSAGGGWVMYEGDTEGMGDLGCLPEPTAVHTLCATIPDAELRPEILNNLCIEAKPIVSRIVIFPVGVEAPGLDVSKQYGIVYDPYGFGVAMQVTENSPLLKMVSISIEEQEAVMLYYDQHKNKPDQEAGRNG